MLLPSAIPSIFAGIRLGLGVSIILVVAAEMVVGKIGLGARLYLAGQILETEQVFAVLIVLAALGIIVTKIAGHHRRVARPLAASTDFTIARNP